MKYKSLFFAALFVAVVSCSEKPQPTPTPENEYVTVSLNAVGGEISSIIYTPIKAEESSDLIGIQVYKLSDNSTEYYAHGIFNDLSKATIKLKKGNIYKFVALYAKDGKNKIVCSTDNGYPDYLAPFAEYGRSHEENCYNSFNYDPSRYFHFSWIGNNETKWLKGGGQFYSHYPIDAFLCEIKEYEATQNSTISLNMKRISFGLKIKVVWGETITKGKLRVSLNDAPLVEPIDYNPDGSIYESMYSLAYIGKAYNDNSYCEDIALTLTYFDESEEYYATPIEQNTSFKRNEMTTVNVTLSGMGQQNVNCGMQVNFDTVVTDGETYDLGYDAIK